MSKRYWLILLLFGCGHDELKVPKIKRSQLVPVIAELRILESAYALRYQQVDSSAINIADYQEEIFNRYQTPREDVTQSVQFYAAHPDSMKALDSLVLLWLEAKYRSLNQPSNP
jgi:hypothetical protein